MEKKNRATRLLCVSHACIVLQGEKKVVCGSGDGILYLFNWDEWGNMSDRFPGHPDSISCMTALSDDIILTGSSDGIVRYLFVSVCVCVSVCVRAQVCVCVCVCVCVYSDFFVLF